MDDFTNRHRDSTNLTRSTPHDTHFGSSDNTADVSLVSASAPMSNVSRYKLMSPAKLPISRTMSQSLESPSSLLDSPVQFCNIKVEPSPTTGSFQLHRPQSMLAGVGYTTSASTSYATSYANNSTSVGNSAINSEFGSQSHSLLPNQAYLVMESQQQLELQSQHNESEKVIQSANASSPDQNDARLSTMSDNASTDGYNWRKYGQKHVKGCEFPRSYYKCTHPNCEVKKLLERTHDGRITEVIYKGTHAHPKPQSKRRFSNENILGTNDEHIERFHYLNEEMTVGANSQAATPELDGTSEHPSGPPSEDELNDDKYDDEGDDPNGKRRKQDMGVVHFISSVKPIREPRVVVQTVSEVDILDDGYRWRKYGQKVVKGNPNPRSYYKCTNPGCPVRKHVERACHDIKSVITTYEGKHNHEVPIAKSNNQEAAAVDPYSNYNNMLSSIKENDSGTQVSNRYQLPPDVRTQYLMGDNEGENFRFAAPYLPSTAYPQNLGSLLMGP